VSGLRVLVACEFSATVRDAFRARGFDAWSCDLLPTEGDPRWHIQGDALPWLDDPANRWDLLIAHPPCNHLAASGAQYWPLKKADGRQQAAINFFLGLMKAPVRHIAVENPVGIMGSVFRKADQIVQPWQFGDPYNKKTCLWLRNLPKLVPTKIVTPTHNWGTNSYRSGSRKKSVLPSLKWGSQDRAKSFPGIAAAMAEQWGNHLQPLDNRSGSEPYARQSAAGVGASFHASELAQ